MAKEKRLSKIRARQQKAEEEDRKRFDIVGHRKIWYILSLLVIIPGIFCMFTKGFNFGIDFTGGTIIDLRFDREVAITEVRDVLKELSSCFCSRENTLSRINTSWTRASTAAMPNFHSKRKEM